MKKFTMINAQVNVALYWYTSDQPWQWSKLNLCSVPSKAHREYQKTPLETIFDYYDNTRPIFLVLRIKNPTSSLSIWDSNKSQNL